MTTPALRALQESRPGRRVTLLTSPVGRRGGAARARGRRGDRLRGPLDEGHAARGRRRARPRDDRAAPRGPVRRGRRSSPSTARTRCPSALLCYLAGIPLRLAHCRENPYQLLTDWVAEPEPERLVRHEVRRQLDLVAAVGCRPADERLAIRVPDRARGARRRPGCEATGSDRGRPWVVIHPGATAPSRRYPPESSPRPRGGSSASTGCGSSSPASVASATLVEAIRAAMAGAPSHSLAGRARPRRAGRADRAGAAADRRTTPARSTSPPRSARRSSTSTR